MVSKRNMFYLAAVCCSGLVLAAGGFYSAATAQKPLADEGDLSKRLKRIPATTPKDSLTKSTTMDFRCLLRTKQYTRTESSKNPGSKRVILL